MAAVNRDPFVYSNRKDGKPHMFKGLVKAGSSQAIKRGEICTWNEEEGYFTPIDAIADHRYPLAIAAEEQKASGRHELVASRYILFYSLHPEDIFEFPIAAAQSLAVGDPFTLTATTTQTLTASTGAFAVAHNVGWDHYPTEEDTTIRNQSYARVSFNPCVSYWGFRFSKLMNLGVRVITTAVDLTLLESDMYNTLILVTAAKTITLPAVKPGMDTTIIGTGANAVVIDPANADQLRIAGVLLTAGYTITSGGAAGDSVHILTEGAAGFIVLDENGTWTAEIA